MVFSSNSTSPFCCDGYEVDVKHVYDAVKKHEHSQEHILATNSAIQYVSGKALDDLVGQNMH